MRKIDAGNPETAAPTEADAGFCLVIETSTPHATLAGIGSGGKSDQHGFQSDRSHNAMLFGPMQELLATPDARSGIRLVLVGSGPGSYSGTRVGIAAAQGVAIAAGCPAVAVPSILAVPAAAEGAPCLAIGDARRGSYWTATIDELCLSSGPALCDVSGLLEIVKLAFNQGRRVFSFEETRRFPLTSELLPGIDVQIPDALGLWRAWCAASAETRRDWFSRIPQPIYLKPPHITPAKPRRLDFGSGKTGA